MSPFTIVFDLDGTLVDTAPDLVATLNIVLTREGLQPVAYADARMMVGGGARVIVERGIKANGRLLPADEIDLVDEHDIGEGDLLAGLLVVQLIAHMPRIDDRYDCVERGMTP